MLNESRASSPGWGPVSGPITGSRGRLNDSAPSYQCSHGRRMAILETSCGEDPGTSRRRRLRRPTRELHYFRYIVGCLLSAAIQRYIVDVARRVQLHAREVCHGSRDVNTGQPFTKYTGIERSF